jgi:hypothetical protein
MSHEIANFSSTFFSMNEKLTYVEVCTLLKRKFPTGKKEEEKINSHYEKCLSIFCCLLKVIKA